MKSEGATWWQAQIMGAWFLYPRNNATVHTHTGSRLHYTATIAVSKNGDDVTQLG